MHICNIVTVLRVCMPANQVGESMGLTNPRSVPAKRWSGVCGIGATLCRLLIRSQTIISLCIIFKHLNNLQQSVYESNNMFAVAGWIIHFDKACRLILLTFVDDVLLLKLPSRWLLPVLLLLEVMELRSFDAAEIRCNLSWSRIALLRAQCKMKMKRPWSPTKITRMPCDSVRNKLI